MSLLTLFKLLDKDNDNHIDIISFKKILNMIDYPLTYIDEDKYLYTYDNLTSYILKYDNTIKIDKDILKNKLKEEYKEQDTEYIIEHLDKSKSSYIKLDNMNSFINTFLEK